MTTLIITLTKVNSDICLGSSDIYGSIETVSILHLGRMENAENIDICAEFTNQAWHATQIIPEGTQYSMASAPVSIQFLVLPTEKMRYIAALPLKIPSIVFFALFLLCAKLQLHARQ